MSSHFNRFPRWSVIFFRQPSNLGKLSASWLSCPHLKGSGLLGTERAPGQSGFPPRRLSRSVCRWSTRGCEGAVRAEPSPAAPRLRCWTWRSKHPGLSEGPSGSEERTPGCPGTSTCYIPPEPRTQSPSRPAWAPCPEAGLRKITAVAPCNLFL